MVTLLLLTGVSTEPIWYEVNRVTKPNAFRFGSYAVTITDSFTGPVLFTPKVKRMDAPNAIVRLIGSGVPSVATNARPRSLATVTNGCGTKVTIRIATAAIPMSFRPGSRRVRSLRGGGCRTPRMKIRNPNRNQPGEKRLRPQRIRTADQDR